MIVYIFIKTVAYAYFYIDVTSKFVYRKKNA